MEHQSKDFGLPGRLGNPDETLGSDPRTDPRLAAAMAPFGLDGHGDPAPVDADSPYDAKIAFLAAAEPAFTQLFGAIFTGLPDVEGVERTTETITGADGNDITLHVHRPAGGSGVGPGILHLHGGGMGIMSAADVNYVRWRDELAAAGVTVVGVEFRNSAASLGPHPFPAGLNDCVSGLKWMHENRAKLGVSKIVVSGESGGGNLTLGTTLQAKREGILDKIAGVYAQCPMISGLYASRPAELPSMTENDDYFIGCRMLGVLATTYDPKGEHANNPVAWPYQATPADLEGLPPHVISVNELDPLRDEGLAFARKLLAAGVSVVSRTVNGTCHAGDLLFPGAIRDVYTASLRDVLGFARSL